MRKNGQKQGKNSEKWPFLAYFEPFSPFFTQLSGTIGDPTGRIGAATRAIGPGGSSHVYVCRCLHWTVGPAHADGCVELRSTRGYVSTLSEHIEDMRATYDVHSRILKGVYEVNHLACIPMYMCKLQLGS